MSSHENTLGNTESRDVADRVEFQVDAAPPEPETPPQPTPPYGLAGFWFRYGGRLLDGAVLLGGVLLINGGIALLRAWGFSDRMAALIGPIVMVPAAVRFFVRAYYNVSRVMQETLQVGDRFLVNMIDPKLRAPQRGEILLFRPPAEAYAKDSKSVFIMRCIGTPGEVVEIRHRILFVNGRAIDEPYQNWSGGELESYDMKIVDGVVYSRESPTPGFIGQWRVNGVPVFGEADLQERINYAHPETLPPGQFLVLGDHRSNSNDSHLWGFLPRRNIVGRVMFVYWPLKRWFTAR